MDKEVTLLLGTNLGNRLQYIALATAQIEQYIGHIVGRSAIYETAPWGYTAQPAFLNQVVIVGTSLDAEEVLAFIHRIEHGLGRIREKTWAARIIDIDILYYESLVYQSPTLTIPHPAIAQRRFTLVPLCEVMPSFVHPILQQTQAELLRLCQDESEVKPLSN